MRFYNVSLIGRMRSIKCIYKLIIVHNFTESNWTNCCIYGIKGGSLSYKDKEINNDKNERYEDY